MPTQDGGTLMHIVMVKKRLANGEPCGKCVQAEQALRNRNLWDRVDEVVWALEGQPESPGMRLAAQHGVDLAPFFIMEDGGKTQVYTSVLKLVSDLAAPDAPRSDAPDGSPLAGVATAFGAAAPPGAVSSEELGRKATELADREPIEILRWGLERWGRKCAIAFSGAEDVVLIDMAAKSGLPFSVFCLDTGRLHPETYRFLDRVRKHYGVEIQVAFPAPARVEDLVRKKGLFSFYDDGHQECCGIRKVEPLRRTLAGYSAWATGLRRDQSPATRSAIAVVERDMAHQGAEGPLVKLNPIGNWTSARVWQYIRENDVPYNELHERGFVSIGCEPCTRAVRPGEHERAGRWWWEEATKRECGLHTGKA